MPRKIQRFEAGDILRTHPRQGYWGCAIVLSVREATEAFAPMCHIGISPFIALHEYAYRDLGVEDLTILSYDQGVRVGRNDYRARRVTCIGIYENRNRPSLDVIGAVDPASVYQRALTYEAGDGTDGKFPKCGSVEPSLGFEAVVEWRRLNDSDAYWTEDSKARLEFEEMDARLKAKEAAKRTKRSNKNDA